MGGSSLSLAIFDIDGTLLLTGGTGARAFNHVFKALFNVENAFDGISAHGKTDHGLISEMMMNQLNRQPTEDEFEEIRARYIEAFAVDIQDSPGFCLLPGVEALLDALSAQSHLLLGIESGNFEQTGRMKLAKGGIDSFFRFGGYCAGNESRADFLARAIRQGKKLAGAQGLQTDGVFVIGDSAQDVEAGRAHNAVTIGVGTGRLSAAELKELGADHAFPDFKEPAKLLSLLS